MKLVKDLLFPPTNTTANDVLKVLNHAAEHNELLYKQLTMMLLHQENGAQMWISKEVTDDLLASEIPVDEIRFHDIEWPHHRLEMYFEDKSLPTFLVAKFTEMESYVEFKAYLKRHGADLGDMKDRSDTGRTLIQIQAETDNGQHCTMMYSPEQIEAFAAGVEPEGATAQVGPGNAPMSDDDDAAFRDFLVLMYKVMLFANSEGHSVRETFDKPTRKQGGKAGFMGRPRTKRLLVEYLPKHYVERGKSQQQAMREADHQFNGRRGHFRRYRSERYKNLQGTIQYIFPVYGPDGTLPKRKFIVRKP